ncbi:hypothetical protein RJ639_040149 [Escallonia herrerae]|uniref:R3H domain-containing protein n=1 Tax=Escallonia herrerae TaxID=1293975 RepID=A0AA89B6R3_9ASTE|nr:hypothetical protein RJ639_040149 [Escallonia herrerae]
MSLTEFAMVEELASLIKDNLPCKHLVLSVEAALVNFLQDDTSSDGVLELEPMSSYNRLLLHRLADIFGFSHQSIGEGDDRHLILERSQETTIPSILVSDLLWQYDEFQPLELSHPLSRSRVLAGYVFYPVKHFLATESLHFFGPATEGSAFNLYGVFVYLLDAPQSWHALNISGINYGAPSRALSSPFEPCIVLKAESPTLQISFEEREAAYLAARERIFSVDEVNTKDTVKQKPRHNPVVARRMIAHALGQKIESSTPATKEYSEQGNEMNIQEKKEIATTSSSVFSEETNTVTSYDSPKVSQLNSIALVHEEEKGLAKVGISGAARNERNIREEQIGAAKRIFAQALRFR